MEDKRDRSRLLTLIGVSVVLHALVFWSLALLEPAQLQRNKPVELELAWVETRPAPTPEPAPTQPPLKVEKTQVDPKKKKQVSEVAPPVVSGQPDQGSAVVEAGPQVGTRGDLPIGTRPSLTPSDGFAMSLGTGGREEPVRGSTIRNGPGEAPDPRSLNEYTGEVLTRKLNDDLQQEVGMAAVGVGNVPNHFKRYENAMRTMLPKSTIDRTPMSGGDIARDVAGIMFNNGPSAEASKKVSDSPLGRSVTSQNVMSPTVDDQRFRESSMQMLAQSENIKERITRARLRTVLEVTTDANGILSDVSIIERSGDSRFDESVLHFSRKVARTIPDNDDKMLGTSSWRTRWQFTWEPPDVRVRLLNAWRVKSAPALQ
ncbi:MAG: energy transducer TonB [Archangium sp.]|nr:energy transducer TonB [Archangium sp.]MDP3152843.1 energy transducer TonB [Archangium sp.]MDP3576090.1 energy transducer TonB [Archangium sp.]